MEIAVSETANSNSEQSGVPSPDSGVVDRAMILKWLSEDTKQLRAWARQPHTIKSPIRVHLLRASIYGCSVMLQALHDEELDELAAEIEEIKKHVGMKE